MIVLLFQVEMKMKMKELGRNRNWLEDGLTALLIVMEILGKQFIILVWYGIIGSSVWYCKRLLQTTVGRQAGQGVVYLMINRGIDR